MKLRIRTASRLHFGLLSLPGARAASEAPPGVACRTWGGVGLMVERPGIDLAAEPASDWGASGLLSERILSFARSYLQSAPSVPLHFTVQNQPPEHQGLGTGTQLALAVARILAEVNHLPTAAPELALRVGRGQRSALGIHGFDQGGFLVEAGKAQPRAISPLVTRIPFPEDWRVLLLLFRDQSGLHGSKESQAFQRLFDQGKIQAPTDALCRLVMLGLVPSLLERDYQGFGEALYEFNRRVGETFAPVQGGPYSHPRAADVISFLRSQQIPGVGQSSWGPGLFAVVSDVERADRLADTVRQRFGLSAQDVLVTAAANHGAEVTAL